VASRRALQCSLAVVAVAVPLLAGCMSGPTPHGMPAAPYATDAQLSAAAPFSAFLCTGGFRLAANLTQGLDDCNHRVTHPLVDNRTFDWRTQHGPANEVSVSVDPRDPRRVAGGAKDYTVSYLDGFKPTPCGRYTVWMGTFSSADGGLTWTDDLLPGFPGDNRTSPLSGNQCMTDPVAVFGPDGTFHFSGLDYAGAREGSQTGGAGNPLFPGSSDLTTASQVMFAQSADGGATFPNDGMGFCAIGDNGAQFNDKQWFAVAPDGQRMIVTWTPYFAVPPAPAPTPVPLPPNVTAALAQSASYISYCDSMDGGRTWGPQRLFNPGTFSPVDAQFSMPAFLPVGGAFDVGVIWAQDVDSTLPAQAKAAQGEELAYTEGRLTPLGTIFQPVLSTFPMNPVKEGPDRDGTGPSHFRVATYPVLAVDTSGGPHNGRRYVVWADQAGAVDTDVQVLLRHSDDGRTWSDPVAVNDVARGDQFVPWVSVDPKGGVHVAWLDRRNDPGNRLLDVYYAYSDDGGEHFHPNVRVTERSFDGDLGHHQTGVPFIGDYIGLSAGNASAVVFWSDTRHTGEPTRLAGSDVYSATLVRDAASAKLFRAP